MASSSSSLSLSLPSSSLPRNWEHNVFPSFHGPDVRKGLLSHLLEKFKTKGIESFIDNEIKRGEFIGPELKRAIIGSKIAIVLLSKNYASSSWCLDELVEIMKCREKLGQTVVTIFYEVDPTDVKKQTGDFGKAFGEACQSKTEEKIGTWRKALEGVATIAGYHSINCDSEAAMIEDIATEILKMLNQLIPACDFERYIGMGAHIEKMRPLLSMDSDEVRMIGILGPPGIGKSTIARILFQKLSDSFQLKAIMVNIKECYPRPCLDEYSAQLQLQKQMLSQMLNQKDMVINHLGVAKEWLNYKKVLLVLDDVDRVAQLDALAEGIRWFGRGSRIIIVTEDVRVLRKHGINHIYTVDLPSIDEALQMFCMYAFGQKYPKDGFKELAWQVVCHAGKLPLGLKVMGSYFRNMSEQEWKKALPKLWSSLDGEIESVLKFSYDALDYDDKYLFLLIAFVFNDGDKVKVEEYLAKSFPCVSQGLDILVEKSLIYMDGRQIMMHKLLVDLGREIVRKQSPQKRQFLVDNAAGTENIIGINFKGKVSGELNISERAFEGMPNLEFLIVRGHTTLHLPHGLSYLSPKLRLLDWDSFPATCLPSNVNFEFIVELNMRNSRLEKLWEENQRLPNLKWMDLWNSVNLKELPDLSTATNLQKLSLSGCSSLVELPSSIGNLHKLESLDLSRCSKLEVLPVNVNLASLDKLDLSDCLSLKRFPEISTNIRHLHLKKTAIEKVPSSIRAWSCLELLDMSECKNLKEFPHALDRITERDSKIQDVQGFSSRLAGCKELSSLYLSGCSSLKSFPEISTNIRYLDLSGTAIEEVPSSIRSWPRLTGLVMSGCKNLKKFANGFDSITERDTKIQEVSSLVQGFPCLRRLILTGCKKLLSLPQLPDSLARLEVDNCESLERLDYCSLRSPYIDLKFRNCFKLNKEARDLIIQKSTRDVAVFPGKEIPDYFTYRANGGSVIVKLNERLLFPSSLIFKVCILLVSKNEVEDGDSDGEKLTLEALFKHHDMPFVYCKIMEKQSGLNVWCTSGVRRIYAPLTEHLYFYNFDANVTSNEFLFKFTVTDWKFSEIDEWVIKECGVHYGDNEDEKKRMWDALWRQCRRIKKNVGSLTETGPK